MKRLYKFLNGNKSKNGGTVWKVGEWKRANGKLKMCKNGFHASCYIQDALRYVPGLHLALVEVRGKHLKDDDKECWREMRVIKKWKWGKRESVKLAVISARDCLKNYEDKFPGDSRPRVAVEAAEAWLRQPTRSAESAARSAESAAWSAAESVAWSAAWSAAESAAKRRIHTEILRQLKKGASG